MKYKYETHLHTSEGSLCGVATGAQQAVFMKEQGYTGIFVTDHFFNGNCAVDRSLPWEEMVNIYCSGYEHAKEMGDKIGLDVFFGIEWNYNSDEYLLYGVSKEWLLANPGMLCWSHRELFEEINKIGGAMVQAHPFRDRPYVDRIHLHPEHVHGIELVNACNETRNDSMAAVYAEHFKFPVTAGSDLHRTELPSRGLRGIETDTRIESAFDYAQRVKAGRDYAAIILPEDIPPLSDKDVSVKPIEMLGYNDEDRTGEIIALLGDRFDK